MKKDLLVRRGLTLGLALMTVVPFVGAQSNVKTQRLNPVQLSIEQAHQKAMAQEQERKAKAKAEAAMMNAKAEREKKEMKIGGPHGMAANRAAKLPLSKLKSLTRSTDSKTLLDSVVTTKANGSFKHKEVYSYNDKGYKLGYVYSDYKNGQWIEQSQIQYDYDENGNQTKEVHYYKDGNQWRESYKYEYKYKVVNGENKLVESAYYDGWDDADDDWRGSYFNYYEYDIDGNVTLSESLSGWNEETHNWNSGDRFEYAYEEGNQTLYASYSWESATGSWHGISKYENGYDNGNQTMYASYFWNYETNSWQGSFMYTYEYDSNGKEVLSYSYYWDAGVNFWAKSGMSQMTYNENGNLDTQTSTIYDDEGNVAGCDVFNYEYVLDEKTGFILEEVVKCNGENNWKNAYEYDEQTSLVTSDISYNWENGEWVNFNKAETAYDSNGYQTLYQSFSWDKEKNDWIGIWKTIWVYVVINGFYHEVSYESYSGYDNNGNWIGSSKWDTEYDDKGVVTLQEDYTWDYDNSMWIYTTKSKYAYSKGGLQTLYEHYSWDKDSKSWIGISKEDNDYDALENLIMHAQYSWDLAEDRWICDYKFTYQYTGNLNTSVTYSYCDSSTKELVLSVTDEYEYNEDGTYAKIYEYYYEGESGIKLRYILTYYYSKHDISAIDRVVIDANGDTTLRIYDMQGRPRTSLAKGLNIVKTGGKTVKVVK